MQWSGDTNAGFNNKTNSSWLPVHPDYRSINVALTVLKSTKRVNDGKAVQKSRVPTEAGEGLVIQYSTDTRFNPNHLEQCYVSEKACYLSFVNILYKC
ncbi:Neutral and basic amino acid transport protein rBAT [Liparis tanakae]|uniref:Neutral and basic amino acid transport protein rBAT n=1 Tax=Liparis tanakae TaxID=230148 RepID=A0A4Z2E4L3_9TELE|nr:Neutral and basic amino acid transport protein rBAT [Liparis tanakae]